MSKRKAQIYKEAERLFRYKGFAATTMRDLAGAVGIEAASLYSHVRSKDEILNHICFRMADKFFKAIEEVVKSNERADTKLIQAITKHVEVTTENLHASAVFFHEWKHLSNEHLEDFKQLQKTYEEAFSDIIDEGINDWIFKPADTKFYCIVIFSSLNMVVEWYDPEGTFSPEEIAAQLARVLLDGIKQ